MSDHLSESQLRQGFTEMAIKDHSGMVIVDFPIPMKQIVMEPQNALAIADGIAAAAFQAEGGLKPDHALANAVVELKHQKLCNRVRIMLISMRDQRKTVTYQAEQLVNAIMSEIL